jgi:ribosomal protein L30E
MGFNSSLKSVKVTYVSGMYYLSFNSSLKSAKVTYVSGRFYLGFNSSLKSVTLADFSDLLKPM